MNMGLYIFFSMESLPGKAPEIDWYFYSKAIAKPGLVDSFRKQVQCMLAFLVEFMYNVMSVNICQNKISDILKCIFHGG